MFCGTRSFSHVDDGSWAPSPRPKRSKLKKSLSVLDSRAKANTNPYSANGLDKFERLLAELEERKKKVLAELNKASSEDTVRFRYANTDDWIPIVIKRPHPPPPKKKKEKKTSAAAAAAAAAAAEVKKLEVADEVASTAEDRKVVVASSKKKRRVRWEWSVQSWAVVMVVVLMCLVFGRAFAVCWATILWYVAPMMKSGESSDNLRKKKKKKKYGERLGSNLSGYTSMKVKKMGDGSAGSGIAT